MKIQGVLNVEGVELHVNIEAPDGERELYVTNIHPSCLIIPRERWRVEYLGLTPEVLKELKDQGITSLDDLLNEEWNLNLKRVQRKLSDSSIAEVEQSLRVFREIALVFDMPKQYPEVNVRDVIHQNGNKGNDKIVSVLDEDVEALGLPGILVKAIRRHHPVKTVRDLTALDRDQLIMTQGVDEKSIQKIETALEKHGLYL